MKKKFLSFPVFDYEMAEEIKPTPAVTPSPLVDPPPEDKRREPKKKQNPSELDQKEDDDTTKRKQQGLFDEYV